MVPASGEWLRLRAWSSRTLSSPNATVTRSRVLDTGRPSRPDASFDWGRVRRILLERARWWRCPLSTYSRETCSRSSRRDPGGNRRIDPIRRSSEGGAWAGSFIQPVIQAQLGVITRGRPDQPSSMGTRHRPRLRCSRRSDRGVGLSTRPRTDPARGLDRPTLYAGAIVLRSRSWSALTSPSSPQLRIDRQPGSPSSRRHGPAGVAAILPS